MLTALPCDPPAVGEKLAISLIDCPDTVAGFAAIVRPNTEINGIHRRNIAVTILTVKLRVGLNLKRFENPPTVERGVAQSRRFCGLRLFPRWTDKPRTSKTVPGSALPFCSPHTA